MVREAFQRIKTSESSNGRVQPDDHYGMKDICELDDFIQLVDWDNSW